MEKYTIAWCNTRPFGWVATVDAGKNWERLSSDNEDDSSEPVDEASEKFGVPTNKWDLLEYEITLPKRGS